MKIVIVTPYWFKIKGGVTTAVYFLSEQLKKYGYQVFIMTPDPGPGTIGLPAGRLGMIWSALESFRRIEPETIHVHGHGSLLLPAVIYKVFFKKRVNLIFTSHTQPRLYSYSDGKIKKERNPLQLAFFNALLRNCDSITCVSRSLKKTMESTGVEIGRASVIFNGVEKRAADPQEIKNFQNKYALQENHPVLCMIAALVWDWKAQGVLILIKAFKKIRREYPKAKLLIVGDGPYRHLLEDGVKSEKLEGAVIFAGKMDNPFVALKSCDVYCHISLNEALPISPLEAMACGKPVIVSNDGGLPEIIHDHENGILTASDPDSVACAVLELLKDPGLMGNLAENAAESVKIKFSWEKAAREYRKLYGEPNSKFER